jgi:hypothetical protein
MTICGQVVEVVSLPQWLTTSNSGAGCVTYRRYAPAVSVHDTEETIADVARLDVAMEAACK